MMNIQELDTAARHRLPLVVVIMNDGALTAETIKLRVEGYDPGLAVYPTPDFAAVALQALVAAGEELGHEVVAVYSQPPRPAGRGHQLQQSPVHALAESERLKVLTPLSLKTPEAIAAFAIEEFDRTGRRHRDAPSPTRFTVRPAA